MSALLVYLATFMSVFFLGLQSLNVNQRMYGAAIATSFFISSGHIVLYGVMPHPSGADLIGYYLGGMTGIAASIWFHQRAKAWIAARWPLWKQNFFALAGRLEAARPAPSPKCGRCGDESPFQCHRCDCPRNEIVSTEKP